MFWPLDWLALRLSPVYHGLGVPRGDGGAVILVPGFMGSDFYLCELFQWLRRIGYRPYMSGIPINAECPSRLTQRLVRTMERAHSESGGRVRLIGHSLGGVIAHAACLERKELAAQLVYLGTPLRGLHVHPTILAILALVGVVAPFPAAGGDERCLTDGCGCTFARALARRLPASIQRAAIYTSEDGVVDWHNSRLSDPRLNYEVGGTHLGLVFNPWAYRVLANLLVKRRAFRSDRRHGAENGGGAGWVARSGSGGQTGA